MIQSRSSEVVALLEVLEVQVEGEAVVILLMEVEVEGQDLLVVVEEEQVELRRMELTYWPPLPPPPGGQ